MIPSFNENGVLPPYRGSDPKQIGSISPYLFTTLDICERFAYTLERKTILEGFLSFRQKLDEIGLTAGFQWLGGSFITNIENIEKRPPNDLDVVTFYWTKYKEENLKKILSNFEAFLYVEEAKKVYYLDHYSVDLTHNAELTLRNINYWSQFFSHTRDGLWKGMISVKLNTPDIDAKATDYLKNKKISIK